MVAPLVSYSKRTVVLAKISVPNVGIVDNIVVDMTRSGWKQKSPFNLDTTYTYTELRTLAGWSKEWPGRSLSHESSVAATNQARARLVNALGDSSSFGATLTAERKKTWGTVVTGVTTALRAAKAVSRGRLAQAAQILGFHPPVEKITKARGRRKSGKGRGKVIRTTEERWVMPDGRSVTKSLANRWLWYSYGVKPLVSDIYNGMDVLTRHAPWQVIEGKGFSAASRRGSGPPGREVLSSKSSVCMSLHVRVANPNLWLANQLGLINPVQWINEAIPFSFVVDWFSNLSQVINQMTDFVGLETAKPITTSKNIGTRVRIYPEHQNLTCKTQATYFTRVLSTPAAKLRFAYERFQWQRGANAISLLVGFLKKSS